MGCVSAKAAAVDVHDVVIEHGRFCDNAQSAYEAQVVSSLLKLDARTKKSKGHLSCKDPTQTVIIFDWDDTLCPVTWARQMRSASGERMSFAEVRKAFAGELKLLGFRVVELLTEAQQLGQVVLMTSALRPSADFMCAKLMPEVTATLKNIPVIYSMEYVSEAEKLKWSATDALMEGRRRAMETVASGLYCCTEGQVCKNIVSIGDSHCKAVASEICRTKQITTHGRNSFASMVLQQAVVARWLSHIVHADTNIDIDFGAGTVPLNHKICGQ